MERRVLVCATQQHSLAAVLAYRLKADGVRVAAIAPHSPTIGAIKLDVRVHYQLGRFGRTLADTVRSFTPDLLIPCDDLAAYALHEMHRQWSQETTPECQQLVRLIEKSLGDSKYYPTMRSKIELLRLATELDISVPVTIVVPSAGDVASALKQTLLPAMIKADQSFGGLGVRKVRTPDEATTGLTAFTKPSSLTAALKDCVREGRLLPYQLRRRFHAPRVSVQACIAGRPANRAVVCENGKVIAGVTVKVLETMEENGPATVIETIAHEQISRDVKLLVAALGISDFVGFDFMLDSNERAWLLELNPRVTPACCLFAPGASSLGRALRGWLDGDVAVLDDPPAGQRIVMFPQEIQRDRTSPLLDGPDHHVPWQAPELVLACLRSALQPSLYDRVARFLKPAVR